MGTIGRMFNMS